MKKNIRSYDDYDDDIEIDKIENKKYHKPIKKYIKELSDFEKEYELFIKSIKSQDK